MVVDVDQLACEAGGEEARDEQRDVAQPLQAAESRLVRRRFHRLAQHHHQRLEARALLRVAPIALIERVGIGKQREQVHHVVLGLVFDRHVLVRQRVMQRVAEEFLETCNRLYGHRVPRSKTSTTLSARRL